MALLVQLLKESPKSGHRAVGQWTTFLKEMSGPQLVSASDVYKFLEPHFKKHRPATISSQQVRKKLTEYVSIAKVDIEQQKKNMFSLDDLHELGRLTSDGYVYAVPLKD